MHRPIKGQTPVIIMAILGGHLIEETLNTVFEEVKGIYVIHSGETLEAMKIHQGSAAIKDSNPKPL